MAGATKSSPCNFDGAAPGRLRLFEPCRPFQTLRLVTGAYVNGIELVVRTVEVTAGSRQVVAPKQEARHGGGKVIRHPGVLVLPGERTE